MYLSANHEAPHWLISSLERKRQRISYKAKAVVDRRRSLKNEGGEMHIWTFEETQSHPGCRCACMRTCIGASSLEARRTQIFLSSPRSVSRFDRDIFPVSLSGGIPLPIHEALSPPPPCPLASHWRQDDTHRVSKSLFQPRLTGKK